MLTIRNGTIITGDGITPPFQGTLYIEGNRILEVRPGQTPTGADRGNTIDAHDMVVFPGLINAHTHGCTEGPFLPTAAKALSREVALKNLDKHLSFGTTTIINCDGFALPREAADMNAAHPVNIFAGTTHTPSNLKAAESVDGKGLGDEHRAATADEMLALGAVMLGEVGGGVTLGGGGMDYLYIPQALKERTGMKLETRQCRALKEAAMGRYVNPDDCDLTEVQRVLEETGLAEHLTAEEARDLVFATVLPPFDLSLQGFEEAVAVGKSRGAPVLVHNSAPSDEATLEGARQIGPLLIAGHTNHSTYTVEEALVSAKELRRLGATIEVCTLDLFGAKQLESGTDYIYTLLDEGLVDTWATDYAAGFWDCQLVGIDATVKGGKSSLTQLIAMASGNVARAIPGVGDRGVLAPGKIADVVIAPTSDLSRVSQVVIGGEVVYKKGEVLRKADTNP